MIYVVMKWGYAIDLVTQDYDRAVARVQELVKYSWKVELHEIQPDVSDTPVKTTRW